MPDTAFDIDSLASALRFQSLLNDYHAYIHGSRGRATDAIPAGLFGTVYQLARASRIDGRMLWAVIDFELTYLSMMRDVHGALNVWVGRFNPEKSMQASVLDDVSAFAGKLDILYNMTSFTLRCRAFWDKAFEPETILSQICRQLASALHTPPPSAGLRRCGRSGRPAGIARPRHYATIAPDR